MTDTAPRHSKHRQRAASHDASHHELRQGVTDSYGSLIFRDLGEGNGYFLRDVTNGGDPQPFTTLALEDHPDQAFYAAQTFPQWQHKLFIGALKETSLIVLAVDGNQVREEGRLLEARGKRIRDVRVGPDGYLYVLTDETNGELLRLSPEK